MIRSGYARAGWVIRLSPKAMMEITDYKLECGCVFQFQDDEPVIFHLSCEEHRGRVDEDLINEPLTEIMQLMPLPAATIKKRLALAIQEAIEKREGSSA